MATPTSNNILLVEDNIICRKTLQNQLIGLGYQVDLAKNAEEAIQLLSNKSYCLIITDLGLPDQPGEKVIQIAREGKLNQLVPLIVYTANSDQKKEETCLALGADKILTKPIVTKALQEAIDECLLRKVYQKKLYHCLEMLQKQLQQLLQKKLSFISRLEESELIQQLSYFTKDLMQMVEEYQQTSLLQDISYEK